MEIGLVHGKMAADEKHEALEAFSSGRVPVLVATTVIEVAVTCLPDHLSSDALIQPVPLMILGQGVAVHATAALNAVICDM